MGRWIQISGFILILMLVMSHSAVAAEEESRLPEIFDVLESIEQNLKEGNFGTASADMDYLNGIFKEQKSTWLLGCFAKEHQSWVRAGESKEETVGAAALGGGTTITQNYSKGDEVVEAKLVISPLASGLGALLNNPAFRGAGNSKQRRLRNGLTVNVQPKEVSGQAGGASLSWKVTAGETSQNDLLAIASGSVNPGCVKEIVGGQ